jgi:hypothetical protein
MRGVCIGIAGKLPKSLHFTRMYALHRNPELRESFLDPVFTALAHHLLAGFRVTHWKTIMHRATS